MKNLHRSSKLIVLDWPVLVGPAERRLVVDTDSGRVYSNFIYLTEKKEGGK